MLTWSSLCHRQFRTIQTSNTSAQRKHFGLVKTQFGSKKNWLPCHKVTCIMQNSCSLKIQNGKPGQHYSRYYSSKRCGSILLSWLSGCFRCGLRWKCCVVRPMADQALVLLVFTLEVGSLSTDWELWNLLLWTRTWCVYFLSLPMDDWESSWDSVVQSSSSDLEFLTRLSMHFEMLTVSGHFCS